MTPITNTPVSKKPDLPRLYDSASFEDIIDEDDGFVLIKAEEIAYSLLRKGIFLSRPKRTGKTFYLNSLYAFYTDKKGFRERVHTKLVDLCLYTNHFFLNLLNKVTNIDILIV